MEWVALAFALADVEMSLLILAAQHGHNDYFPPPSTTIRPWAKWMHSLPGGALPPFGGARVAAGGAAISPKRRSPRSLALVGSLVVGARARAAIHDRFNRNSTGHAGDAPILPASLDKLN